MRDIPTLYEDYDALMLDLQVYAELNALPSQDLESIKQELFAKFEKTHPYPTLENLRYRLSDIARGPKHIGVVHTSNLVLQTGEFIVDRSQGEPTTMVLPYDCNKVNSNHAEYWSYENALRMEQVRELTQHLGLDDSDDEDTLFNGPLSKIIENTDTVLTDRQIDKLGTEEDNIDNSLEVLINTSEVVVSSPIMEDYTSDIDLSRNESGYDSNETDMGSVISVCYKNNIEDEQPNIDSKTSELELFCELKTEHKEEYDAPSEYIEDECKDEEEYSDDTENDTDEYTDVDNDSEGWEDDDEPDDYEDIDDDSNEDEEESDDWEDDEEDEEESDDWEDDEEDEEESDDWEDDEAIEEESNFTTLSAETPMESETTVDYFNWFDTAANTQDTEEDEDEDEDEDEEEDWVDDWEDDEEAETEGSELPTEEVEEADEEVNNSEVSKPRVAPYPMYTPTISQEESEPELEPEPEETPTLKAAEGREPTPEELVMLSCVPENVREQLIKDLGLKYKPVSEINLPPTPAEVKEKNKDIAPVKREDEPTDIRAFVRKHPRCDNAMLSQYFSVKEIRNALRTGRIMERRGKYTAI